ncbi:G protein pathway suppressor 2 [Plakobranchus ocellatus]|uniref:G protein pathway suppressor 2 n=1 Tax=Plakobranchus ocellatus TaxID=259542 RepID=A0AAV3ZFE6_9GAST|nr:G protein pathway suppressor 2 [Plakobranchus ocellatus]
MPSLLERPKMTRAMYEALKRHIMREREKKKQEQEQDAMMERLRKERELKKKKEEEDNLTLEQTNEQILQLEKKLEDLKQQKKDIYSQLKKASHQEDETLKRAQQKEQSEMTMSQPTYPHPGLTAAPQPMLIHGRPALYKPTVQPPMLTGMKRQRSPSPPPSSSAVSSAYTSFAHSEPKYPHTSESKYVSHGGSGSGGAGDVGKYSSHAEAAAKFGSHPDAKYLSSPYQAGGKVGGSASGSHLYAAQHPPQPGDFKSSVFQPSSSSHLYGPSQAAALQQQVAAAAAVAGSYPNSQSGAGKYPGPGQSAFTSYQNQFAQSHAQSHAQKLVETFSGAYSIQRMQQPGYHTSLQLQQTLDHAGQKQGGFEDKYKHSQGQIRGLVPPQQPSLMSQAIQLQQQQAKNAGAFVPGYPARSQPGPPTSSYPSSTSSSTYSNPNSVQQGRPGFGGQSHRYY